MDIFDFCSIVGQGDEDVVRYFQHQKLLVKDAHCIPCGRDFTQVKKKETAVGYMLRCPGCKRKQRLTLGTMYDGST